MISARSQGLALHLELAAARFLEIRRTREPVSADFDHTFPRAAGPRPVRPDHRRTTRPALGSLRDAFDLDLVTRAAGLIHQAPARLLVERAAGHREPVRAVQTSASTCPAPPEHRNPTCPAPDDHPGSGTGAGYPATTWAKPSAARRRSSPYNSRRLKEQAQSVPGPAPDRCTGHLLTGHHTVASGTAALGQFGHEAFVQALQPCDPHAAVPDVHRGTHRHRGLTARAVGGRDARGIHVVATLRRAISPSTLSCRRLTWSMAACTARSTCTPRRDSVIAVDPPVSETGDPPPGPGVFQVSVRAQLEFEVAGAVVAESGHVPSEAGDEVDLLPVGLEVDEQFGPLGRTETGEVPRPLVGQARRGTGTSAEAAIHKPTADLRRSALGHCPLWQRTPYVYVGLTVKLGFCRSARWGAPLVSQSSAAVRLFPVAFTGETMGHGGNRYEF